MFEAKLAELNQTITLRQLHGINAALPIMLSNTGKALMDKSQAITVAIQSQQNNMLDLDTRQSETYEQNITYTIIITTAAGSNRSVFTV